MNGSPSRSPIILVLLVLLLLVVMGIAALYAYAQKQPGVVTVSYSEAVAEIQQGKVKSIQTTVGGNTASIELRDGTHQRTTYQSAESLERVVADYNASHPAAPIDYQLREESQTFQWLGQLLFAVLPIVFIGALFLYVVRVGTARAAGGGGRGVAPVATADAPKAIGPYAQAIASGDLVFCSGQIALDPASGELVAGGIAAETRRVLDNLAAVLRASGSDLAHVVKTTVFLTDLTEFNAMNAAYAEAFGAHTPARATVEVSKLPRGARVEIECVATRAR